MVRDGAIYFVGRFTANIVAVGAIAVYTRLLDKSELGLCALIVAGGSLAFTLTTEWLRAGLHRFAPGAQDSRDRDSLLSTMLFGFFGAAATVGLTALVWAALGDVPSLWIAAGFFYFAALSWTEINLTYFNAGLASKRYAWAFISRSILSFIFSLIFILYGAGGLGLIWGFVLGNVTPLIATLIPVWGRVRLRLFSLSQLREMARYSAPLALSAGLGVVIVSTDKILIAHLMDMAAVGAYAAPTDFIKRVVFELMMVIHLSGFPLAVRAYEAGDRQGLDRRLGAMVRLMTGIGLPAAVFIAVLAPVAALFFGLEFRPSAAALIPWAAFSYFLSVFFSLYLTMAFSLPKATMRQIPIVAAAAIINIIANIMLIPRYGVTGAAGATFFSYCFVAILATVAGRRLLILPFPVRDFCKLGVACAAGAVLLWPARQAAQSAFLAGLVELTVFTALATAGFLAVLYVTDFARCRIFAGRLAVETRRRGMSLAAVRAAMATTGVETRP